MKITRRQLRQMILEQMDVTVGTGPGSEADKLVDELKDIAAEGWIRDLLADGLTPDQIRVKAQQGEERSTEWMRDEEGPVSPEIKLMRIVKELLETMEDVDVAEMLETLAMSVRGRAGLLQPNINRGFGDRGT
jgi:hypothetical protein